MFFGKECNYRFATSDEEDYDVFFLQDVSDKSKDICDLTHDHWNTVDTCILWAGYHIFEEDTGFRWMEIKIQDAEPSLQMSFHTQDELLEAMWETLEDVNTDEEECIEQNWFIFEKGTSREDIWHWFDRHHSKGVGWLINEYEPKE